MAHGYEAALLAPREILWREVAASVGGAFVPGDFWTPDTVTLENSSWKIRLRQELVEFPLTLVEADLILTRPVRLTLLRGEFTRSWKGIDLAPRPIHGPAFYSGCQLTASDPALARDLFSRPGLRAQLLKEPHLALDLRPGALRLAATGALDEKPRLIALLATAVELLQRLRELAFTA